MNKQEAMEIVLNHKVYIMGQSQFNRYIPFEVVEDIIEKLDTQEVQKVGIPRYVSEWIGECKGKRFPLRSAMKHIYLPDKVNKWLLETGPNGRTFPNQDIFARAWLEGYEVEEEKLYIVELPDPNRKGTNRIYLCKADNTGKVYICKGNFNPHKNKNLWLTEEEIKKDFDWAWQFREEVN